MNEKYQAVNNGPDTVGQFVYWVLVGTQSQGREKGKRHPVQQNIMIFRLVYFLLLKSSEKQHKITGEYLREACNFTYFQYVFCSDGISLGQAFWKHRETC